MNILHIFHFLLIASITSFELSDLNSPIIFKNEICSYNGTPEWIINPATSLVTSVKCTCLEEYASLPSLDYTINGVKVQCSYQRKHRFIALFLSWFLPIGVDYWYLQRYWISVVICLVTFSIIISYFYFLIESEKKEMKSKDKEANKSDISRLVVKIFLFLLLLFYIVNIIWISTGIITDGNGIETLNDLNYLFNLYYQLIKNLF